LSTFDQATRRSNRASPGQSRRREKSTIVPALAGGRRLGTPANCQGDAEAIASAT
jgi:hypothetical protein